MRCDAMQKTIRSAERRRLVHICVNRLYHDAEAWAWASEPVGVWIGWRACGLPGCDKVHVPRMGIGWSLDRAVALAGSRLWSLVPRLWSRYLSVAAEQSCHGRLLGLTATLATLASPHCNSEGETSRG